jgi:alpha-N-arabinofuranosidase
MPTFGSLEATVLEHAYDDVDFISAHAYYENQGDLASFLASSVNMDVFITDVIATADHIRARLNKTKRIHISFDEWNVWYHSGVPGYGNVPAVDATATHDAESGDIRSWRSNRHPAGNG